MNQNIVTLIGRLAGDPQLKTYQKADGAEGFRTFFRLAVTRNMDRGAERDKQRASFIPVVCWGEAAKRHAQYLAKGTECCVVGELIVDSERQADGSYREYFNVSARDVQYGQRSAKNATPEQLQKRIDSLNEVMERTKALANAAGAGSSAPSSEPAPAGSEFQPESETPAAS